MTKTASSFHIGRFPIGRHAKPFIIAEMSGNHNQSLDRALALVDAAADSGAHGLKIQTFTPETMTLDLSKDNFTITDPKSLWHGQTLYKLYKEAMTPWEWHSPIFDRARSRGMVPFSTPFDASAVDFLESLDSPCYKIASFENTDIPLIRRAAATGKPLIISAGMATISELDEAVRAAREAGCRDLVLLKCTSTYPALPIDSNILTIPHLREIFGCEVGLSDHTMGLGVAVGSVALGAVVIEKHFTLARADGGIDSAFSMEPAEMRALVTETERVWQSLGRVIFGTTANEKQSLKFRRSLYVTRDMKLGETFDTANLRAIRPGGGLPPKFIDQFLGRRVNRDVACGTPVCWDLLGDSESSKVSK
jgi:pseudaminic acid synthase